VAIVEAAEFATLEWVEFNNPSATSRRPKSQPDAICHYDRR
jgi:hypothetical protein